MNVLLTPGIHDGSGLSDLLSVLLESLPLERTLKQLIPSGGSITLSTIGNTLVSRILHCQCRPCDRGCTPSTMSVSFYFSLQSLLCDQCLPLLCLVPPPSPLPLGIGLSVPQLLYFPPWYVRCTLTASIFLSSSTLSRLEYTRGGGVNSNNNIIFASGLWTASDNPGMIS